jgi:micrococcal nuclease
MKFKTQPFILGLFFLLTFPIHSYSEQNFGNYDGAVYINNYDGDTITFNLQKLHPIIGKKISIRVNGIDTPEIRGRCDKEKYNAVRARDMVVDILKNADQINLKNMMRGKYFRIAADVFVDGQSLADKLIEAGMAVKYAGGGKNTSWCE